MFILFPLLFTFFIVLLIQKVFIKQIDYPAAGSIALAGLLIIAGVMHFIFEDAMVQMLPEIFPVRYEIVYLTGFIEFLIACGLLYPATRHRAGIAAIILLTVFIPVNIFAAWYSIPFGGHAMGPKYLFVRLPVQVILIGWAWFFSVRNQN